MAVINGQERREDPTDPETLREERRRTGRYIATSTAIILSLLGLYQAVVRGTPQYAALFAPALIMFIYILWILNASKKQRKASFKPRNEEPTSIVTVEISRPSSEESSRKDEDPEKDNCTKHSSFTNDDTKHTVRAIYSRSYSIA